ncbi:MAG: flagellar basal body P-ring protein FlgI [Spirochaetia bacterium]
MRSFRAGICICLFLSAAISVSAQPTVRIKDIAQVQGMRDNQLVGFGLVTGLNGQGDSNRSAVLMKSLSNLMGNFGMSIDPEEIRSKNSAVVMVTSDIPGFARTGDRINVHVSSLGDARSLRGGVLLQTNLKAANGSVYAVAQGIVSVTDRAGIETTAVIPGGALVETEIGGDFVTDGTVNIILKRPDFATADAVAAAIREELTEEEETEVRALDAALVRVTMPEETLADPVSFISRIERIEVQPDPSSIVVVNPRTGVVVIGDRVRLGTVAVSFKGDSVTVGRTTGRDDPEQVVFLAQATVSELVDVMQSAGLKTDVIIEVLQAVDAAGALYGTLIVM